MIICISACIFGTDFQKGMDKRSSVCVGLTCEDYSLSKHVGREPRSFGYNSEDGRKWRNGDSDEYLLW